MTWTPSTRLAAVNQRLAFLERLRDAEREGARILRAERKAERKAAEEQREREERDKRLEEAFRDNLRHMETLQVLRECALAMPIRISVTACDGGASGKFHEINPKQYKLWMTGSNKTTLCRAPAHYTGNAELGFGELIPEGRGKCGVPVKRFRPLHDEPPGAWL